MLLINFSKNHLKLDIINKFNYNILFNIPKLKKIILTFYSKNFDTLILKILLLKFVCKKEINIQINNIKQNLMFKIKKGFTIFFKLVLKNYLMEKFFNTLINEILPFMIKIKFTHFKIKNLFLFKKLEKFFYLWTNLPSIINLNIYIIYNINNFREINYINKQLKFINLCSYNRIWLRYCFFTTNI